MKLLERILDKRLRERVLIRIMRGIAGHQKKDEGPPMGCSH